jgi:hypothetical protein
MSLSRPEAECVRIAAEELEQVDFGSKDSPVDATPTIGVLRGPKPTVRMH